MITAGADIARFGRHTSAFVVGEDTHVFGIDEWGKTDLMDTAGRLIRYLHMHDIDAIAIDDTGLGGGVSDRVKEYVVSHNMPTLVLFVNFGGAPLDKHTFHDKASEMWWRVRENLDPDHPNPIRLPGEHSLLPRLTKHLTQAQYKFDSSGRIWVDKTGRKWGEVHRRGEEEPESPDLGDALGLMLEAWIVLNIQRRRPRRRYNRESALSVRA